jgi:hypothetical protein
MGRVIAAAAYSNGGKVADIAVEESSQWAARPDHFVWIGIEAAYFGRIRPLISGERAPLFRSKPPSRFGDFAHTWE